MTKIITIDTGGTFTDVAAYDVQEGSVSYGKNLTDYGQMVDSALASLANMDATFSETMLIKHGTTHVINTLIQRTGARTALVTTRGFRDSLEIGRGNRPVPFSLDYRREPPLVPRGLRYEVDERIDAEGRVLVSLDIQGLHALCKQLEQAKVEAVAVSFLNSYANPVHENEAMAILRDKLPGAYVTCGSRLTREWFEYERTSTAVANAYVGSHMSRYIRQFDASLKSHGFRGALYMMGSSGGVMSVRRTLQQPIAMVESGPVAGCIGAAAYARALGLPRVIAFDMGGTTAKCALVRDGEFEIQPIYYVGGYDRGFPLKTPVLDIVEVGAGGGSIASVDEYGRLAVGPRSAGSVPGPVAFGRGGKEPTVTDANLALGRIGGGRFLNGNLHLDISAARRAIQDCVASPLGFGADAGVDRAAQGVLDLATTRMCSAVKEITIERGHDVRDYVLLAFGGGGPLFASALARSMGIASVVVPPNPGNFCAVGMLLAGARIDLSRTVLVQDIKDAATALEAAFRSLEDEAQVVVREDLGVTELMFKRTVEMRYRGQKHTVRISFTPGQGHGELQREFEKSYAQNFGQAMPRNALEIIGVRLGVEAKTPSPMLSHLAKNEGVSDPEPASMRNIYVSPHLGRITVPVWDKKTLSQGNRVDGPAVIEEFSSTTYLQPGDRAVVGTFGELHIQVDLT